MAKFRLLDLIKPFQHALPEVENPVSKAHLSFDDRILYSIGLAIFFLVSQLPIYGVTTLNSDPFFSYRAIFAAERGTLAEFGVLPIIASGFLWQFLAGFRLLNVNFNSRIDRGYFQSLQKLTSFVLGGAYAFALVFLVDYYNPNLRFKNAVDIAANVDAPLSSSSFSLSANLLIWLQLFAYNVVLTYVIEILDKDYGFTSGALVLIAVNIASTFVGGLFDFTTVYTPKGYEYKGVIIQLFIIVKNLFSGIFSGNFAAPFFGSLVHLFSRSLFINLKQVTLAIVAFFVIFYLQSFHQAIPIKSKQVKTMQQTYPVKLFFNGALPLLFAYAVFYNLKIVNYTLYNFFNFNDFGKSLFAAVISSQSNFTKSIVDFFVGSYAVDAFNYINPSYSKAYQVSGLASYFQPPLSLTYALLNPIQTIVYLTSILSLVLFFSINWSKISGSSGKDISDFFAKQNITVLGKRDANLSYYFGKIISSASVSGGLILAGLAIFADLVGGQGFPSAIIIAVLIAFNFLEAFFTEFQQSGGSNLYNGSFGQSPSSLFGQ